MFLRQPDGGSGRRGGENHLDAGVAHDIHDPFEPGEVKLAVLGFAEAPAEVGQADDVDARLHHQFSIVIPLRFGIFSSAAVGEDPVFGIVIDAEIHKLVARWRSLPHSNDIHLPLQFKSAARSARGRDHLTQLFGKVLPGVNALELGLTAGSPSAPGLEFNALDESLCPARGRGGVQPAIDRAGESVCRADAFG